MKRIVTSILGATLLAGTVYAAGNQGMTKGMDHSTMNKNSMAKCEAFMKKYEQNQNSWTPKKNILLEAYPASNGN